MELFSIPELEASKGGSRRQTDTGRVDEAKIRPPSINNQSLFACLLRDGEKAHIAETSRPETKHSATYETMNKAEIPRPGLPDSRVQKGCRYIRCREALLPNLSWQHRLFYKRSHLVFSRGSQQRREPLRYRSVLRQRKDAIIEGRICGPGLEVLETVAGQVDEHFPVRQRGLLPAHAGRGHPNSRTGGLDGAGIELQVLRRASSAQLLKHIQGIMH